MAPPDFRRAKPTPNGEPCALREIHASRRRRNAVARPEIALSATKLRLGRENRLANCEMPGLIRLAGVSPQKVGYERVEQNENGLSIRFPG